MLDLMAVSSIQGGGMPLYLHVVSRILREMRITQQQTDSAFDYKAFKKAIDRESLTEGQLVPLQQRLETLESFMVRSQILIDNPSGKSKDKSKDKSKKKINSGMQGESWELHGGQLTIVDLSCPCVTAEAACSLFNICLSLFLEQKATIGRVVALDEAHKYMNDSSDSQTLTESLLSVIRLQRHLGTRVVLSTQEPTVSPKLLDLCSTVIVHRFTSPAWFTTLRRHLAGVSLGFEAGKDNRDAEVERGTKDEKSKGELSSSYLNIKYEDLFTHIIELGTGEALLFCPSALVDAGTTRVSNPEASFVQLGSSAMKVRIRKRITEDGGTSIMAN
ncbi:P-loop containing protein [Fusarium acuminatum]|uniref:P-loop containing protein n=1 Tax=Fusarium acuminatum TaxID=5515 RepID=A0ABZ2WUE9_9HYPO